MADLPSFPGTVRGRVMDHWRYRAWTLLWWAYRARRTSPWLLVAVSPVLAYAWLLWPLIGAASWIAAFSGGKAHLLTEGRSAALAIRTRGRTWVIDDHIARNPGAGEGRRLRALVLPGLREHADRHGITVRAVAAHESLAALYRAEVPGLDVVGTKRRGRIVLERRPA